MLPQRLFVRGPITARITPDQRAKMLGRFGVALVDRMNVQGQLRRLYPDSAFVFVTERGGPFTPDQINRLVKRIGHGAQFGFPVHAHMLRHACGYALANAGHDTRRIQDWLGHRSIQHTTRYSQLSAARFKDFWR